MISITTSHCLLDKSRDVQFTCKAKIISYRHSLDVVFPLPSAYPLSHFQKSMLSAGLVRYRARDVIIYANRRHHRRRRPWKFDADSDDWMKTSVLEKQKPVSMSDKEDDKVVITLDLQNFGKRTSDAAAAATNIIQANLERLSQGKSWFANNSAKIWRDLRSSVAVQKDARIVVALRWSTIDFLCRAILFCLVVVGLGKLLFRLALKYRWGWEEGFSSHGLVRRDRSLGGREVIVSMSGRKNEEQKSNAMPMPLRGRPKPLSPLDGIEPSRSEKKLSTSKHLTERTKVRQLPKWWPSHESSLSQPDLQAQAEANQVVQDILKKRQGGTDFAEEDMLKIRQTCKQSGAKVNFGSSNTRDTFYRAAIDLVLSACSRNTSGSSPPLICNENVIDFITGLATDIELDLEKAATMINAAVAARTRSCFLQAWALSLQGRFQEAENEIVKLVQIHSVFCPESNSPEMEMVASGLEKYLDVDERKELLQIYKKVGRSVLEGVANEALGIV